MSSPTVSGSHRRTGQAGCRSRSHPPQISVAVPVRPIDRVRHAVNALPDDASVEDAIREVVWRDYRVIYWSDGEVVQVLSVLHSSRQFGAGAPDREA